MVVCCQFFQQEELTSKHLVGENGFEPLTSRFQTACSAQTELHPENLGTPVP